MFWFSKAEPGVGKGLSRGAYMEIGPRGGSGGVGDMRQAGKEEKPKNRDSLWR